MPSDISVDGWQRSRRPPICMQNACRLNTLYHRTFAVMSGQHGRHPPIYMQDDVWLDTQGQCYLASRVACGYMHGRVAKCALWQPDTSDLML
jgi:hypothetical protein